MTDYDWPYISSLGSDGIRKARKDYTCKRCKAPIRKGDRYYYFSELLVGEDAPRPHKWETTRLCLDCYHR